MNELIRAKHETYKYELKEGTSSSYYLKDGLKNVLPERISYSKAGFKSISNTGRALTDTKVGQVVGAFKVKEVSKYKLYKPYSLFSSIWQVSDYPIFIGYGDIGITKEKGIIESTKDLFILYQSEKEVLEVHLFKGLLEFKDEAFKYLKDYILK